MKSLAKSCWIIACAANAAIAAEPSKVVPALPEMAKTLKQTMPELCKELDASIAKFKWNLPTCAGIDWKTDSGAISVEGRPLMYAEFGDANSTNTTLVLSMVHPDEVTPLYLGYKLVHWLKEHEAEFKNTHVVIAPFVNPDGHFKKPPVRMNARGVDLNRNFFTKDWKAKAVSTWQNKLRKNPRRFPGWEPASEPETNFQEILIRKYQPKKILTIHAPLNVMDYDGPSSLALDRFPKEYVQECLKLRARMKAKSTGYFPGSLGNFAGQELGIPTVTLELPSADSRKAEGFWLKFREGIRTMIEHKIENAQIPALAPAKTRS